MENKTCLFLGFVFVVLATLGLMFGTTIVNSFANIGISTAITSTALVILMPAFGLFGAACTIRHIMGICPCDNNDN